MSSPAPAILLEDLVFEYHPGRPILDLGRLEIAAGETVFLGGPSGCGKTTLLGLLAGVLTAQAGRLTVLGQELAGLSPAARDALRGERMGYIFQLFNLLPYLSLVDNITLPCRLNRRRRDRLGGRDLGQAAREMAEELGLAECLEQPVAELSVGQQQRAAAARALLGDPDLLIADEPTSSLDADRRRDFLELLFRRCRAAGTTVVFVSHDRSLSSLFDRALDLGALRSAGDADP